MVSESWNFSQNECLFYKHLRIMCTNPEGRVGGSTPRHPPCPCQRLCFDLY